MKWFYRTSLIVFISIIVASCKIIFDDNYFDVIYTVLGIMFSVGMGQILSFSFSDITNIDFVQHQRTQLQKILIVFVILFAIVTLIYIFHNKNYVCKYKNFIVSLNSIYGTFFIFCMVYFIQNFFSMFDLKNEIEDLIRKTND